MATVLFDDGNHQCIAYHDDLGADGVPSNQFLVKDGDEAAIIDPGGDLTYGSLLMDLNEQIMIKDLKYVIVSHQDPDVSSSIRKWNRAQWNGRVPALPGGRECTYRGRDKPRQRADLLSEINSGKPFVTSGCPGAGDVEVSACNRPYGDSAPSDIRSFPFLPQDEDISAIKAQVDYLTN